jgi:hypothetical protein
MNNLLPLYESLGRGDIMHGANPNASTRNDALLKKFKLLYMLLITRNMTSVSVVGVGPASRDCNDDVVGSICLNEVLPHICEICCTCCRWRSIWG